LLDRHGRPIAPGGKGLLSLHRLELDAALRRLRGVELCALADVDNPLLGPSGARMYMAQKGATASEEAVLEEGLQRFAELAKSQCGVELGAEPGTGAAGGLGAAMLLLGARLCSGAESVMSLLDAEQRIAAAQRVLSAEGSLDVQTGHGKVLAVLAKRCAVVGRPLDVFVGRLCVDRAALDALGIRHAVDLKRGAPLDTPAQRAEAMAATAERLEEAVVQSSWG
jgi:glycerate kinase